MMRKSLFVLLILWSANLVLKAQDERIVWETDFKQAQVLARETGRPLLLDFTAKWCGPCQEMEKTFWVLPEVVSAMKPFVAVKVDFDRERGLANKYGTNAIPFVVFADPIGNMVTFRLGFSDKNVKDLNQILSEMPKDFSPVKDAYGRLDLDKNDGGALLQVGDFYGKTGMTLLANDFYKRALKTDAVKNDAAQKERLAYTMGANYYIGHDDARAVEFLGDYLKDYPTAKYREVSLAMLAISHARLGKEKEALKYLETIKKEFPDSRNLPAVNKAVEDAKLKKDKK